MLAEIVLPPIACPRTDFALPSVVGNIVFVLGVFMVLGVPPRCTLLPVAVGLVVAVVAVVAVVCSSPSSNVSAALRMPPSHGCEAGGKGQGKTVATIGVG